MNKPQHPDSTCPKDGAGMHAKAELKSALSGKAHPYPGRGEGARHCVRAPDRRDGYLALRSDCPTEFLFWSVDH